jgi:hypothetical protein
MQRDGTLRERVKARIAGRRERGIASVLPISRGLPHPFWTASSARRRRRDPSRCSFPLMRSKSCFRRPHAACYGKSFSSSFPEPFTQAMCAKALRAARQDYSCHQSRGRLMQPKFLAGHADDLLERAGVKGHLAGYGL